MLNARLLRYQRCRHSERNRFHYSSSAGYRRSTPLQIIRDVVAAKHEITILIQGCRRRGLLCFADRQKPGSPRDGAATGGDIEYVNHWGRRLIDYKRERFEGKAAGVDAMIDLVGGDTLAPSYAAVSKGGMLATTIQPIDESAAKRAGASAPHRRQQRHLAANSGLNRDYSFHFCCFRGRLGINRCRLSGSALRFDQLRHSSKS